MVNVGSVKEFQIVHKCMHQNFYNIASKFLQLVELVFRARSKGIKCRKWVRKFGKVWQSLAKKSGRKSAILKNTWARTKDF